MGWTSMTMYQPVKTWFKSEWEFDNSKYEVIDSALVKRQTIYGAIRNKITGQIFCAVYLVKWSGGRFFYKDMTEFVGPMEVECPKKIFKLLTPLDETNNNYAIKWREAVQTLHNERDKAKNANYVTTKQTLRFTNGMYFNAFKKIGKNMFAGFVHNNKFIQQIKVSMSYNHLLTHYDVEYH